MTAPTAQELKALTIFYQFAAPNYGFYDFKAKSLKPHAAAHGLFIKNLEMLREMLRKGLDLRTFEDHCRFCRKEGRKLQWVSEVVPEVAREMGALDKNLLIPGEKYLHRLLVSVSPPVSSLPIGAESSESTAEMRIEQKEEFTLEELVEHFSTSFAVARSKDLDKALAGSFNYLLSNYPLDVVLFAMDYAIFDESYLRNPLMLQDSYIPQALEELQLRKARLLC